jgi:hypothetical protein
MKNLMVFATALMIGTAALADVGPRVYRYSANLKTTVAKQEKVTYKDSNGVKTTEVNCYRKAGNLKLNGVFFLDCDCYDFDGLGDYGQGSGLEGTQFMLLNTSFNKKNEFFEVPFTDDATAWDEYYFWGGRRFGSSVTTKAKDAELGLTLVFDDKIVYEYVDPSTTVTNTCGPRQFWLDHAGFGKVTTYKCKACGPVESDEDPQYDIDSISGSVVGDTDAPFCFTSSTTVGCGFCGTSSSNTGCGQAMAFYPCAYELDYDQAINDEQAPDPDSDVVFGTWKMKLDQSLSTKVAKAAINNSDKVALKEFLGVCVFGKNAVELVVP